ncbi:MAG: DUF1697 domain-containing protein [Pseudomonadota bacterium]
MAQASNTRLVALLGSINTGGNRLTMDALRAALTRRGFANVATVTASGNVLFDGDPGESAAHADGFAACLSEDFGIETFAIVLSAAQLEASVAENPFVGDGEDNLVHVHFLEARPGPEAFDQLLSDHQGRGHERIKLGTVALHIDYVDGVGRSKLTGPFLAKRLGCRGTARNIRSLRRILEAMG